LNDVLKIFVLKDFSLSTIMDISTLKGFGMSNTFNTLPEAQAYAQANGLMKYWRVWFTDTETRKLRARGGWHTENTPASRIYMDLTQAIETISSRAAGTAERTEIETLWTEDVSNSLLAR